MKTAELRMIPVSELKPAAYNPRKKLKSGDKEYEKIKNSIEEFGFADPLVVNADMTIIGGHVKVRIASIAASAATVIAMAGDVVQMSPTALILIHDPSTIAMGNTKDMEKAITTLNEVKESIINAYAAKTGLSRSKISKLMSDETWMNAKKAVELGFADEILFDEKKPESEKEEEELDEEKSDEPDEEGGEENPDEEEKKPENKPFKLDSDWSYSTRIMGQTILGKIGASCKKPDENDSDGKSPDTPKSAEKGLTTPMVTIPDMPVIGMDGKTQDGAMPYEILKQQLAFLK